MKIRFLKIVWIVSACWVAALIYGAAIGSAAGELPGYIVVFGWPSLLGFLICYLLNGSFSWPKDVSNNSPQPQPINDETTLPEIRQSKSSEEDFLDNLEQSKRIIAAELESSRLAMEREWESKFDEKFQKIQQIEELIKKSDVIQSCLLISKQTYHWASWIDNQKGEWLYPAWISKRIVRPDAQKGDSVKFESYVPVLDKIVSEEASLQTAFSFKADEDEISQYIYLTGEFQNTRFGRLLVKVNKELVLDVSVSNGVGEEYDNWKHSYGEIHFAKIEKWISKIINLETEFQGQQQIEKTVQRIKEQEHKVNNFP